MLENILKALEPYRARLVAVSKTKPASEVQRLYDAGQRIFGENKVQELQEKKSALPHDIEWHLIGHLQTNKAKQALAGAHLIHSLDSLKLYETLTKEAEKLQVKPRVLLQFHIAQEETKFGLNLQEAEELLKQHFERPDAPIQILGVMGMASFSEDLALVRREFRQLRSYFDQLKSSYFANDPDFCERSMGMSGDYQIALEEGSTLVRIGSLLFGSRV